MKKVKVTVTRTVEYEVEVDETLWGKECAEKWQNTFWDLPVDYDATDEDPDEEAAIAAYGNTVVVVDALPAQPASGDEAKVHRVPGTSSYTDYQWNGTTFKPLATITVDSGAQAQVGLFTCGSAAATVGKSVTASAYELKNGGAIKVKFTSKNTADNPTLNINSQGAKALYYHGEPASATNSWKAGETLVIYYDETNQRYYANGVDEYTNIMEFVTAELDNKLTKGEYDASTAVGLADNIRGDVYADEQFAVRMTGGEANEVGGIGVVQQLKGAGAAIVQLFPEGANHDFSGDVSLDGTGGNAEAVLRYSNGAGTVEMGYLLCLEAFVSQTLSQAQLDAISAKDTGKADRDKAVWLTPAGAITSAPTIESGQTEVTFSGWRIAMRVKASEVRDAAASSYWFTAGTAGRQVYDVAVAEGIDCLNPTAAVADRIYALANGWNTDSAMEYLQHMAAQGLPTHSVKAMSALLAVTKIGIKTVKSRNLLNPQTGRALLKAYVNDDENFEDNEYTMLGGLPSGSTMSFTSLLTGKTETLTMLDSTHFVIPSDGWLQITGTLPESIIATWDGTKDNTAADEYATESHVWDVTQLFGTKDGGTEGHYYRFAKEGMRGADYKQNSISDIINLAGGSGNINIKKQMLGDLTWYYNTSNQQYFLGSNAIPNGKTQGSSTAIAFIIGYARSQKGWAGMDDRTFGVSSNTIRLRDFKYTDGPTFKAAMASQGVYMFYPLATPLTFTSLFLSASSTSDELTQMPADAIPLSEIQFADCNWSIEEAIYDAPEADANGVITPTAVTGQMRIQYSLDAAEQIDTLQKEYQALEARVTALENA